MAYNTDLCSVVQRDHAKYFNEELEGRLKVMLVMYRED